MKLINSLIIDLTPKISFNPNFILFNQFEVMIRKSIPFRSKNTIFKDYKMKP